MGGRERRRKESRYIIQSKRAWKSRLFLYENLSPILNIFFTVSPEIRRKL